MHQRPELFLKFVAQTTFFLVCNSNQSLHNKNLLLGIIAVGTDVRSARLGDQERAHHRRVRAGQSADVYAPHQLDIFHRSARDIADQHELRGGGEPEISSEAMRVGHAAVISKSTAYRQRRGFY